MIRQSDTIVELAAALVAAQAEMPNAPKETKGQVGSQIRFYTDLPTVTDLIRPILAKHKLAFLQFPSGGANGAVTVTTRLIHTSGEWIEDDLSMPTGGNGAQGVGSALTYAKRYSLMSVLGVAADDDDGAAASTVQKPARQTTKATRDDRPPEPTGSPPTGRADPNLASPTDKQTKKMMACFNDIGIKEKTDRLAFIARAVQRKVESSKDLTIGEAATVIDQLENVINGRTVYVFNDDGAVTLNAATPAPVVYTDEEPF